MSNQPIHLKNVNVRVKNGFKKICPVIIVVVLQVLSPRAKYSYSVQDEGEEYECASVLNSHSQDVKHVQWHPQNEVHFMVNSKCMKDLKKISSSYNKLDIYSRL